MVTTLTTVGFGDVVAKSLLGKAVVIATICIGVVVIPVQAAQLYAEFAARRVVRGGSLCRAQMWVHWSVSGLRGGDACGALCLHVHRLPHVCRFPPRRLPPLGRLALADGAAVHPPDGSEGLQVCASSQLAERNKHKLNDVSAGPD